MSEQTNAFMTGTAVKPSLVPNAVAKHSSNKAGNNSNLARPLMPNRASATDSASFEPTQNSSQRAAELRMSANQGYNPPASNAMNNLGMGTDQSSGAGAVSFNNLGANVAAGVNFSMDQRQVPSGGAQRNVATNAYGQSKTPAYGFTGGSMRSAMKGFMGRNTTVSMSASAENTAD
jgi:hypothetical protein